MTLEERTRRALTDILGFADEISQYVTSLGEQNFYRHRPTQLSPRHSCTGSRKRSHAWETVSLRSTRQSSGKR